MRVVSPNQILLFHIPNSSNSFSIFHDDRRLNSMESIPSPPQLLKAVTLTHVRYQRHDPLGHFLAWISLIPIFVSLGGFVTHFVFRREIQSLFFALGLTLSQFLSDLIKSSVQQSRPATCAALEMCDSHGWPSSHSQYMFFFSTYFSLLCLRRSRFLVALFPWPAAVLTLYSRVYLGYHTVAQVWVLFLPLLAFALLALFHMCFKIITGMRRKGWMRRPTALFEIGELDGV